MYAQTQTKPRAKSVRQKSYRNLKVKRNKPAETLEDKAVQKIVDMLGDEVAVVKALRGKRTEFKEQLAEFVRWLKGEIEAERYKWTTGTDWGTGTTTDWTKDNWTAGTYWDGQSNSATDYNWSWKNIDTTNSVINYNDDKLKWYTDLWNKKNQTLRR